MSSETTDLKGIEKSRIDALKRYHILGTEPEESFDHIANVASTICEAPIALISFLDADRQWFKSCVGIEMNEMSRGISFCSRSIEFDEGLMEVSDTKLDPRFTDNDLVTGPPHVRFYAAAPIATAEGFKVGSLCVMDYRPRTLSVTQKKGLTELAKTLVSLLERNVVQRENNDRVKKSVRANAHEINNALTIALARIDSDTDVKEVLQQSVKSTIASISHSLNQLNQQLNQSPSANENQLLVEKEYAAIDHHNRKPTSKELEQNESSRHATAQELNTKLSALADDLKNNISPTQSPQDPFLPTLLIAEDDIELGNILKTFLSQDFKVLVSTDGESARKNIDQHQPDIVLLDWMLPKVKGIELCQYVKNSAALKFTKVILLTALQDDESKLAALNSGADDFLSKPITSLEIRTRLNNLKTTIKLENELKAQNQQLTDALANLKEAESQLIHSAKLSAIGSLVAGLLHEVNNPLNYVIAAVQLLGKEEDIIENAELNELTTDIRDGVDRIKLIVKDLHAFAYPSELKKGESFVLASAINSALRFTSTTLEKVRIDNKIDQSLLVKGSKSHIVQVLINLLSNAGAALNGSDNDRIELSARISESKDKNDDKAQQKVIVEIRDNGHGIAQAELARIFEPFYTNKEVGKGLGMGLSISNTIIENHGGVLQITSEEGAYTSCTFDLNLVG